MGFTQPNEGSSFKVADYVGALVLVYVRAHEQGIVTDYQPNGTDAIRADIVVLDGPNSMPEIHADQLIFQKVMIGQLRGSVGRDPVLGRIGTGVAKPGRNAPYRIDTFTPADAKHAETYLAQHPDPFAEPPSFSKPAPAEALNTHTGELTPPPAPYREPVGSGPSSVQLTPEVQALLAQLAQQQGGAAQAVAPPF